jgi:hypothetical protein
MRIVRRERGCRRPAFWVVVAGCVLSVSVVVARSSPGPGPEQGKNFLGLWEGVDSLDGSPVRLSVSDIDDDGVLELTLQEDFWTFCFGLGPTFSRGRGVETGTATVASRDVIDVETQLTCLNDNNEAFPQGVASVQYTLRSRGRVLVLPAFPDSPAIVLAPRGSLNPPGPVDGQPPPVASLGSAALVVGKIGDDLPTLPKNSPKPSLWTLLP